MVLEMLELFALPSVKDGLFWHLSAPLRCVCIVILLGYLVAFFYTVLSSLRDVLTISILKTKSCSAQHNMIFQTSLRMLLETCQLICWSTRSLKKHRKTNNPPSAHTCQTFWIFFTEIWKHDVLTCHTGHCSDYLHQHASFPPLKLMLC